jgi:hypothetical protein
MTVDCMLCHLCDSFRMPLGERYVSPATGFFQRTLLKTVALRTSLPWQKGFKTRPEVEQGVGGSAPVDFEEDRVTLLILFERFCDQLPQPQLPHPIFGPMMVEDWMVWGFRHTDHHLRQFGR